MVWFALSRKHIDGPVTLLLDILLCMKQVMSVASFLSFFYNRFYTVKLQQGYMTRSRHAAYAEQEMLALVSACCMRVISVVHAKDWNAYGYSVVVHGGVFEVL